MWGDYYMFMEVNIKPIMDELRLLRQEISEMKKAMPDKEMFLCAEESRLLEESRKREKQGKLISSKDMRKEIGI